MARETLMESLMFKDLIAAVVMTAFLAATAAGLAGVEMAIFAERVAR